MGPIATLAHGWYGAEPRFEILIGDDERTNAVRVLSAPDGGAMIATPDGFALNLIFASAPDPTQVRALRDRMGLDGIPVPSVGVFVERRSRATSPWTAPRSSSS